MASFVSGGSSTASASTPQDYSAAQRDWVKFLQLKFAKNSNGDPLLDMYKLSSIMNYGERPGIPDSLVNQQAQLPPEDLGVPLRTPEEYMTPELWRELERRQWTEQALDPNSPFTHGPGWKPPTQRRRKK